MGENMYSLLRGFLIVILLTAPISVSMAQGATAGIHSIELVKVDDRDCDGRASEFSLLIEADTDCVGCNDESPDSPNIEPYFHVSISGDSGELESFNTDLPNKENLRREYKISNLIDLQSSEPISITVELNDNDPIFDENLDKESVSINAESSNSDPRSNPDAQAEIVIKNSLLDQITSFHSAIRPQIGDRVSLDASQSTFDGCRIVEYQWDLDGDGTTDREGKHITHTFRQSGQKEIDLTVVDERGVTDSDKEEIYIYVDTDRDNLPDSVESKIGADMRDPDTDNDMVIDGIDPMPTTVWMPIGVVQAVFAFVIYAFVFLRSSN